MVKTAGKCCKFLVILLCTLYIGPIAIRSQAPAPPQWSLVWMTSGSSLNQYNNQTTGAQIFYDWRQRSQAINLMREGSYTYTIFNIENTTKTVPDVETFSWVTAVETGVPCRLGWLNAVHFEFSFYSDNPDLLPKGIFDVLDYCPQAADMYGVKFTSEEENHLYGVWDAEAWGTMPMLDGSLEVCHLLHQASYELVCVTAMAPQFTDHRLENFRSHGFQIDRVISTDYDSENPGNNPKQQAIEDSKRNFKDIHGVHTRFVFIDKYQDDPKQHGSIYHDVKYPSLLAFRP
ncbi:unnamed protein product [Rotaria socialis]|uniref:Uncharacterized protein n=2 Tax=Rotaria socialis TaxID=392032 RepID=A0A820IAT1_9BILA|nr:unnamed protein product [Rotaria socialis]CAF4306063.1 unnamed protein product [Rotaria socialis]CAF4545444.1 unnamed protein product [Rotaria socialis]CAF4823144.1 unnamed protein product [Rotaria socialis]